MLSGSCTGSFVLKTNTSIPCIDTLRKVDGFNYDPLGLFTDLTLIHLAGVVLFSVCNAAICWKR